MTHVPARALVLLRVPHGAAAPGEDDIRRAIAIDRARLALPPAPDLEYRVAGPYTIEMDGGPLDEYVAWEV